jgi:hypothetical protein
MDMAVERMMLDCTFVQYLKASAAGSRDDADVAKSHQRARRRMPHPPRYQVGNDRSDIHKNCV